MEPVLLELIVIVYYQFIIQNDNFVLKNDEIIKCKLLKMIYISKNTGCAIFLIVLLYINVFDFSILFKRNASLISVLLYCAHDFIRPPEMKWDMTLHHYLTIILASYGLFSPNVPWVYIQIFLLTEVSTVFLVLKKYNINNVVVNLAFVATFLYYRVFNLFRLLFIWCLNYKGFKPPIIAYYSSLILYGLNIYWMFKIFYMVFQMRRKTKI